MSGGGGETASTTFKLAPEQEEILDIAMPFLRDAGNNPPQPPSGTAIAPFNEIQEFSQAGALGMAPLLGDYAANAWDGNQFLSGGDVLGSTPFTSQFNKVGAGTYGEGNNNAGMKTLSGVGKDPNPVLDMLQMFTSGDLMNVENNPALRNAMDAATRPIIDSTLQRALPAVRQDFIGAGQYGGTKQGLAESQAIADMQRQVGDTTASMANRAYETGMQGTLQGLGLYSGAYGQDVQNLLAKAGMQDAAFGRQQQGILDAGSLGQKARESELDAMIKGLGIAPQTAGLGMLPWQVASAVGDTQYGLQSAQTQEAYQQQQLAEMWNLMLGQELATTASLVPGGTNISKTSGADLNPFSAALGGLGLFGGLGSMFGFL